MPKSISDTDDKMVGVDSDSTDKAPNSCRVRYIDIGVLVYGIILHFIDTGFDIFLAYSYFMTKQYSYFAWTAAFTIVPTAVMSAISIRMYIEDSKGNLINWKVLLRPGLCVAGLILQLAPVIRYFDSILYARKCLKAESQGDKKLQEMYYKKMLKEDSDAALLRVFECYLESACQQVLQITLLLIEYSQGSQIHLTKQCIMITLSFISMGWCMATYHRCIRFDRDDKQNISTFGTLAQFLWHLNFTVSRIIALAALAILYPFWTCIAVAGHWCAMTIWIAVTAKTNFCGKSLILEVLFASTVGLSNFRVRNRKKIFYGSHQPNVQYEQECKLEDQ
ncbi:hypothetical protein RUM44_008559 [Polyplax serrata]|uniref:XK-related protein n=1 Tax=Polyplax serrata TaxID=468196 RepID=A0ABR1BCJ9_POLSC